MGHDGILGIQICAVIWGATTNYISHSSMHFHQGALDQLKCAYLCMLISGLGAVEDKSGIIAVDFVLRTPLTTLQRLR
jgi:hypothetical protein